MPCRSAGEAGEHGVEHLGDREPVLDVELGREPDLGVHDAVGGEVLGALGGDALDRVAVLHHADRVGERLEVEHEVVALGAAVEPGRELLDVGRRQLAVVELLGELDDGRRPQAAVEVVVQEHLRRPPDHLVGHWSSVSERAVSERPPRLRGRGTP